MVSRPDQIHSEGVHPSFGRQNHTSDVYLGSSQATWIHLALGSWLYPFENSHVFGWEDETSFYVVYNSLDSEPSKKYKL